MLISLHVGTVEIEALSMVEMINGHIIPSVKVTYLSFMVWTLLNKNVHKQISERYL